MDKHWRHGRALSVVAVAALMASACSPASSPAPTGGPSPTAGVSSAPGPTESAAASIPQGGTLSIAYASDLQHLDPAVMYDTTGIAAVRLMFESPLSYDTTSTKLVPLLATALPTISPDGKTYTITLKKGVKFV